MPQIGQFTRTSTGFAGRIRTLSFDTDFVIAAIEPSAADNAPDYRVHLGDADGPEVGAGWTHTGPRSGQYVAILIDDPVFLTPIRANLFRTADDDDTWSLHWSRSPKRGERS